MRTLMPLLTCVLLTVSSLTAPCFAKYSGGTGQPSDPYLISTPEDMNQIGANPADWDSYFLLINDINLAGYTGTQFNIIGNSTTKFTGVFDGNDHKVINLTIDTAGAGNDYLGLFGYIGEDRYSYSRAELKNLGVEDVNITGGNYSHSLGGLCGYNDGGIISNCYTMGQVTGGNYSGPLGGLVGYNDIGGRIRNCFSTGQVTGGYHSAFLGGLVGDNHGGTISNSYSTGSVSGDNVVGGLVGGNSGRISNCYSTGQVTGESPLGGLTGNSSSDKISNCFWDVNTSGLNTSFGGVGKTTAEMQTMSTFTYAGWDFAGESANGTDDIWLIPDNHSYPILWFQASSLPPLPRYSGGTGTLNDPFLISTPEDLDSMRVYYYDWDKHFLLTADINMAGYTYTTALIAPDTSSSHIFQGIKFTGLFDGAGFKIKNLTINTNGAEYDYLGLFGYIDSTGTVENLGAEDINITGGDGSDWLGGLVGENRGTISDCYSTGSVTGGDNSDYLGGLVGRNERGTISNCYSTGSVTGGDWSQYLGGLVGYNPYGTINNCFSTGQVIGDHSLGGLCGWNPYGTISNCFWDVNTSGLDTSSGGIGKTTIEMQTMSTFTDAGWDFTTPVWKICETTDYPRLAWQKIPAPILYPEPDITTGTQNTITWQQVTEAVEYYAVCCNDPNLEELIMDTGWLDTNEVTFAGLDIGNTYYYAVKARQNCVMESDFSNVESSMQGTLGDAVDVMLDPNSLKNANMANALSNKIDEVLAMIDAGNYQAALKKLENDILKKTDGCANSGEPDKNDWIETCEQQARIYPLIMETIEYVESLIE